MFNKKKISLLIASGLAVSLSAFPVFAADAPASPPKNGAPAQQQQSIFDGLQMQLKLTDAQKKTVVPVLAKGQMQFDAIRTNKDLKPADKSAQTLAIFEGLPQKLNATLKDEQKATLAQFVAFMKQQLSPAANRPAPLQERLNLTDKQKQTVVPILDNAQKQLNSIGQSQDLKPADKRAQTLAVFEGLPKKLNPQLKSEQKTILAKFVDGVMKQLAPGAAG